MNDRAALDGAALDRALVEAHRAGDFTRLVELYTEAARRAEVAGAERACRFFLTQAYVFALVTGGAEADDLHARLRAHGAED